MGFEVVRIALAGSEGRKTLQVMADRLDGAQISVDDCANISHALSAIFDVEEPVAGRYDLEISSAGIDRPLTRLKDFANYAGHVAKIETRLSVNNRRRFRGTLDGVDGQNVKITTDEGQAVIGFDNISAAKLMLTDELIAAMASRTAQTEEA
jgi:ribosome maturation factor RimP